MTGNRKMPKPTASNEVKIDESADTKSADTKPADVQSVEVKPVEVKSEPSKGRTTPIYSPSQPNSVRTILPSKGGIEVVALRNGWYNHSRRKEFEKFFVSNMDALGTWMKCTDPKAEEQHQETMLKNKVKRRTL